MLVIKSLLATNILAKKGLILASFDLSEKLKKVTTFGNIKHGFPGGENDPPPAIIVALDNTIDNIIDNNTTPPTPVGKTIYKNATFQFDVIRVVKDVFWFQMRIDTDDPSTKQLGNVTIPIRFWAIPSEKAEQANQPTNPVSLG